MGRRLLFMHRLAFFSIFLLFPVSGWAVVYVDAGNVKGPWDGDTWATAYRTVQKGLDDAEKRGEEVWVAKGIYKPTKGNDRKASFRLRRGVAIYGGFRGTETARDQRNWKNNVTVLSGDIGKQGDRTDNAIHVVIGADDAVIDGFTITGGYGFPEGGMRSPGRRPGGGPPPGRRPPGMGPPTRGQGGRPIHITPQIVLSSGPEKPHGGGMINFQCAPTIRNCTFKDNWAGKGGAMYNMASKQFRPGLRGGAEPAPRIINCTFIGNYARGRGGAVSNDLNTHPTFIGCTFIDNKCDGKGGAMYNDFRCSPTITNSLFVGNDANKGGAIGNDGSSSPTITNCTFTGNRAGDLGAALYQGTGPSNNPIVTNCIIWGNSAPAGPSEIVNWHECNPVVTYSLVDGGYPGEGNIDADPLFVDEENGDYRLEPGSPGIDAGNGYVSPEMDMDGNTRYDDRGMPDGPLAVAFKRGPPPGSGPPGGGAPPGPPPMKAGAPVDMGAYERREDTRVPPRDVVYVDRDSTKGHRDGKSWATAFDTIQEALDYAYRAGAEVWVAEGTYHPTEGSKRTASMRLRAGVAMYGGFEGRERKRNDRDWKRHVTILSGDIGIPGDRRDNVYHVLTGADEATIDGFTITGGNADGSVYNAKGGGMVNYVSRPRSGPFGPPAGLSPTIANCTFIKNNAIEGGAIYSYDRCSPIIRNAIFKGNRAENGGAILDRVGVKSVITNCNFSDNYARWRGGATYFDYGSRPVIKSSIFENNSTGANGGAMYSLSRASQLENTIVTIKDSIFKANKAAWRGGAIASTDQTINKVANCTFEENQAGNGGGAMSNDDHAETTLTNCTFAGNTAKKGKPDIDTDATSKVTLNN